MVRAQALSLLIEGPYHPELTDLVASCLANDRSQEVRDQAFELVATLPPDERFVPGLAAYLGHETRIVRHLAGQLIRRAASQNAVLLEAVLKLLDHPEPTPRNNAHKALQYPNRVPEVITALLKELDEAEPESKKQVGPALRYCEDRQRVNQELVARISAGDDFERSVGAAYAMAHCANPGLKSSLEVLVRDPNELYGCAGILGIEIMEAKDMVHELRGMLGTGQVHEDRDESDYPDWGIPD